MDQLICKDCGTQFPNQPPYRRTGKFIGDIVTCPKCGARGTPKAFMKSLSSPGIGFQLQTDPNFSTPSQLAMKQMFQTAQKLDNKGYYKIADIIEKF